MRTNFRGHFLRRVMAYVLVWCLVMNTSVPTLLATPTGGVFTQGTGTIVPVVGGNTTVTVDQTSSVIQWGGLDTSAAESLTFLQGGLSNSAVLNRVMSGAPTHFFGTLTGDDMRIFIVNPAGIIFEGGSTVNVSQLVLSGLDITNWDPVTGPGDPIAFGGGSGEVTNHGEIYADSIMVVGKKVRNVRRLYTNGNEDGFVVMAAGEEVFVAQDGSSVIVNVSEGFYSPDDTFSDVRNSSGISANRGTIVLAAGDTFSRAIVNTGYALAKAGTLVAHAARVESTGVLSAKGSNNHGDAGTVTLTGLESVSLTAGTTPGNSYTTAEARPIGDGGSITIESEGTVTIGEGHLVLAHGGAISGDGGQVKITAEQFVITGDIEASPQNPANANGTLTIDPPTVTVASGANAGAVNTIYEEDIEALSTDGTNLVVYADESITVQDIFDDLIGGGRGDIEFHAPTVTFEDTVATDTLSTTTGHIVMAGGAGGVTTGHLETGAAGLGATPGEIRLSTTDGGDISTRNLTIKGGQGSATIDVRSSGNLTVDGAVAVGADTPIDNVPGGADAEAMVYLESGDDMALNGGVTADAEATNAGDGVTKAHIRIFSGKNEGMTGDLTVGADLASTAQSNEGTSDALVEVDTFGEIEWIGDAKAVADGDSSEVHVEGRESALDEGGGDRAEIIINERGQIPDLEAFPDEVETHMGDPVSGNVLDNDVDPDGGDIDVLDHTDPAHGTLTLDLETGEFTYTPDDPGFVGEDTFTYRATDEEGVITDPATVTIDVTNDPPDPVDDTANTHMNQAVEGNVLTNDTDANGDPLSVVLDGTAPAHGTVVLNEDGTFTYTPDEGYVGGDTFTYDVTDGQLDAGNPVVETGTVTVNIGNQPPTPVDDVTATFAGRDVSGNVLANDIDPDGDPLSVVLDGTPPTNGTVVLSPDGSFTYSPDPGFTGEDTFTYEVTDGQAGSTPVVANVTVTVSPIPAPRLSPVAPGLERRPIEYSGIPALAKWVALELGVNEDNLEIWMTNALASSRDIQPFETYAKLRTSAVILKDVSGAHIAALTQVINEFASSTAPPTEEQMASIADAIASNAGADNHYGIAEEYLNALAQYISILNTALGFSMDEAVQFATANYVNQLAERGNANVAAYVKARLAEL